MARKAEPPPVEIEQAVKDFNEAWLLLSKESVMADMSPAVAATIAAQVVIAARLDRIDMRLARLTRPGRM